MENKEMNPWEVAEQAPLTSYMEEVGDMEQLSATPTDESTPWEVARKASLTVDMPMPKQSGFDMGRYIKKLAATESSNNPTIRNKKSTATGLYQFVEDTWIHWTNKLGLDYTLEDRKDPAKAEEVVKAFTESNRQKAKTVLGREPNMVETYMYHFLGNADRFMQASDDTPATDLATKRQVNSNKSVFYKKNGEPRTKGEVLAMFSKKFGEEISEVKKKRIDDTDLSNLEYDARKTGAETFFNSANPQYQSLRKAYEELPVASIDNAIKAGLHTEDGRKAFRERMLKEFDAKVKGMSAKERDKYWSNDYVYMREEYPEEFDFIQFLGKHNLTNREIEALRDFPISFTRTRHPERRAFVYSNKGDRAFVYSDADVRDVIHEAEHLMQQKNNTNAKDNIYIKHLVSNAEKIFSDKTKKEVFEAPNSLNNLGEFLANISSYESSLPEGKGLKDTEFYKDIVKQYGKKDAEKIIRDLFRLTKQDKSSIFSLDENEDRRSFFRKVVDMQETIGVQ